MILYVANWPLPRISVWNTLLKARAIENLCYVAGVNRVGHDPYNEYNGDSAIIDFKGVVISSAPERKESVISAELSLDELAAFREKFPAHLDADEFTLM